MQVYVSYPDVRLPKGSLDPRHLGFWKEIYMYHSTNGDSHDVLGSGDTAGNKNISVNITPGGLALQSLASVKSSCLLSYSWTPLQGHPRARTKDIAAAVCFAMVAATGAKDSSEYPFPPVSAR